MKPILASLLVASALIAGGCSTGAADTGSTLPSAPSTPLVTDNFSGTVQVGSSDFHTFTVTSSGFPITIDLTSAGPPATIAMGIGVGTVLGGTCQVASGTSASIIAPAGSTPQLSGTITSGQYCLLIADVGNQSGPITYTAVILHY